MSIFFMIMNLLLYHNTFGMASPLIMESRNTSPSFLEYNNNNDIPRKPILSETILSPAPTPSPLLLFQEYSDHHRSPQKIFNFIPFYDCFFDLSTLCMIFALIVLSILCMCFIFHLRFKSRLLHHLQNFNSFWHVRLALTTFALIWAINEVIRLPFLRRKYLYPFLPFLTLTDQSNLCQVHVVLSFGFLQPGFLITLLFLLNKSVHKKNSYCIWPFASICAMCCPLVALQILVVTYSPLLEGYVPSFMYNSSNLSSDLHGNKMVLCSYPLFSCLIFAGFTIAYSLAFTLSSWRVVEFVINKSIRGRMNMLSFTVMVCLPVQIICLGILSLWMPQDPVYFLVSLVMFVDVAFCMAVGQIILVIKPIADALVAGGACYVWRPEIMLGHDHVLDGARR